MVGVRGRRKALSSVLKRDDAARQTEEWYLHIFQAKGVKVCDVPQEKLESGIIAQQSTDA